MLKKIKRIKDLGIFQDFTASQSLLDFSRFNLIYGWNGSGKTTLARLLNSLEAKTPVPTFPGCEFELLLDDSSSVKHNSLSNFKYRMLVFNQQFIEDNIDWKKQGTKTIVVISEDKIEDRNKFLDIRDKKIPAAEMSLTSTTKVFTTSEKERDDFLTDLARGVKQSFQVIDTNDKHYFNYDRTKLRAFISSDETEIKKTDAILGKKELEELTKKVRPIQRPEIVTNIVQLPKDKLIEGESKIIGLLKTSVISQSIKKLQETPDINTWVQTGVEIHTRHKSKDCEFCDQPLPANRLSELEAHYSKEYSELLDKLTKAKDWLIKIEIKVLLPDTSELYEELQQSYKEAASKINETESQLIEYLNHLDKIIVEKINNPFNTGLTFKLEIEDKIKAVEESRNNLHSILSQHNQKTKNFETDIKKHKHKLELHYVAQGIKEKKYFDLIDRIGEEKKTVDGNQKALITAKSEKAKLEASLANVAKGAEDFNKELHSFLGRNDISLAYDSKEKAYRIMRTNPSRLAENLSEGEKTAIAFIFFITKLYENGNKVEDSIIVVDDPISSFDANHLFHSLAFLKRKCENAKQLFILTHNFQYFKMVRDWLLSKNKKGTTKSSLFAIEVEKGNIRKAGIFNAHDSLLRFGSEYQYLFKKLNEFKEEDTLDIESAYQSHNPLFPTCLCKSLYYIVFLDFLSIYRWN